MELIFAVLYVARTMNPTLLLTTVFLHLYYVFYSSNSSLTVSEQYERALCDSLSFVSTCLILSKSGPTLRNYNVITIFKMAAIWNRISRAKYTFDFKFSSL